MERLIVYETDKGNYAVRPEQWAGIIDKNRRIKECGLNHTAIFHYKKDAEWYVDAKNAEEQGLLLRLPCKVGGNVYCLTSAKTKIVESSILWIEKHSNCLVFALAGGFGDAVSAKLGETWFLTKEEAEQALAKMKEV